jgi:hypothetical protein
LSISSNNERHAWHPGLFFYLCSSCNPQAPFFINSCNINSAFSRYQSKLTIMHVSETQASALFSIYVKLIFQQSSCLHIYHSNPSRIYIYIYVCMYVYIYIYNCSTKHGRSSGAQDLTTCSFFLLIFYFLDTKFLSLPNLICY